MITLKRPMREKKRLSDDMMEFVISQLKFKKADEPLLENFTKATVSHSNPPPYIMFLHLDSKLETEAQNNRGSCSVARRDGVAVMLHHSL